MDSHGNLKRIVEQILDDDDKDISALKRVKKENRIHFRKIALLLLNDPMLNKEVTKM